LIRLIAERYWQGNAVNFYAAEHDPRYPNEGPRRIGLPVVLDEVRERSMSELCLGPTLTLQVNQVQELIDQLWTLGFRPSEGSGSAGSLAQAEDHIKTLKAIVTPLVAAVVARP
jgi:hypothetical protein